VRVSVCACLGCGAAAGKGVKRDVCCTTKSARQWDDKTGRFGYALGDVKKIPESGTLSRAVSGPGMAPISATSGEKNGGDPTVWDWFLIEEGWGSEAVPGSCVSRPNCRG
jgi:hypothetical protein